MKLLGSKSLFCSISWPTGQSLSCPSENRTSYLVTPSAGTVLNSPTEEVWFRAYGRWDSPTGVWSNYLKWCELRGIGGPNRGVLFQPANGVNQNPPTQWVWVCNAASPNTRTTSTPYGAFELRRWYCIEAHMVCSPTIGSQIFEGWIDGVQMHSQSAASFIESMRYQDVMLGIINGCHANGGFHCQNWTDGIATSSQRIYPACTVELANGSNYATATKRYQAPVSISDSSVQFTFDSTTLTGTARWVFVTDNQQNRTAGFQVV
jgi:hypothetical protein